ncbi:HNH endonuclease [Comamonas sp. B-9]|uniref:HNH endonuclease n=1 Tax=Comamonas sp. B-9 TaxID=1055192 RepID=UPI0011DE1122|nr:HNH endonuclease [Comamonas sp. B-9]
MSKIFEAVGECIYCGSTDNLTDEHVVPYGINGDMLLPKSSCLACNKITSKFEQIILKGIMQDARNVGGLKTRNKKSRSKTVNFKIIKKDESVEELVLPINDAVAFLHVPVYTDANYPYGGVPGKGAQINGLEIVKFGRDLEPFLVSRDAIGFAGHVRIDANAFGKMLAKIAYSFYIGEKGVFSRSESPALALIKGEVTETSNWVGSSFVPISNEKPIGLHRIAIQTVNLKNGSQVDLVLIQLFAMAKTCTYEVVVKAADWKSFSKREGMEPIEHNLPTPA